LGFSFSANTDSLPSEMVETNEMARSYSEDLRRRVIAAIEGGLSTRAAARRFDIGESTAGAWHRLWRMPGDWRARKQGQPSGSKLDIHEAFILDLTETIKDISLAEVAERLHKEHGLSPCPATVWHFFSRRGITFKKNRSRLRAGPQGSRAGPGSLV
jgi:transposase